MSAPTDGPVQGSVQGIDPIRLADWLRAHVKPFRGSIQLSRLSGGQSNPTFRVEAGEDEWVLRRKPPGALLASAHAVDREYRVMAALAESEVPVPRMHALCEDSSVIGSAFVLMELVHGRVMERPDLPELAPEDRSAIYRAMAQTLAAIHRVDLEAARLTDYGRPLNYLRRQIDRWTRQYRASQTDRLEPMEHLIEWLPAQIPAGLDEHPGTLVHGDYRLDNLILHPTEPRVLAVIDWELSTLGNPWADLAYHLMSWRVTPDEFRGLRGYDLLALGIPGEDEHRAAYLQALGLESLSERELDWLIAFNMFRMAAILQGILARAQQGNAAASDAMATGQRARRMAEAGWAQVEQRLLNA